ncbi:VOC family protein [Pelatocladus sp. BLCC-F211]|uniref:VOC family protein n=1 Tax=Pelatocladus sp. BLCC-F211 TaxID=3342752 RepID=UPI0035B9BF93
MQGVCSWRFMLFQCTDALVTLASFEFERLVSFYTNFFNQKPEAIISNVYAEFQLPSLKLGIFKPKQTHYLEFERSTKSKISLCLEVSNLEDAITHLSVLGYPPPGEIITASHGREIYAYDPDGNRLILHQSSIYS